ncbi:MAG: hypothetical protein GY859_23315, partial [Desulfobacterales bacterium]|nr:hypothetical protein [Desulfobacterales bacterium]
MVDLIKNVIKRFYSFMDRTPLSSDEKMRFQHYTVFLLLGIPTMVVYGLSALFMNKFVLFLFIMLSATGLAAGWFLLLRFKNKIIIHRINITLFCLLILYMLLIGGQGGSKIPWMYTFPLICFFLLGKNEGLLPGVCKK